MRPAACVDLDFGRPPRPQSWIIFATLAAALCLASSVHVRGAAAVFGGPRVQEQARSVTADR